jgi:hypothetical protein
VFRDGTGNLRRFQGPALPVSGLDAGYVSTYYVFVNVTLSLDDRLLERARRLAARRGISLNQMIRDYLTDVTGAPSPEELVAELDALWTDSRGDSRGWRFNREELHDRAVLRRH